MSAPAGEWSPGRSATIVALAALCFATSGPLARLAAPAHPLLIAAGRTALASGLLFAAAPGATVRGFAALPARQRGAVLGVGVLLAAHFGLFLGGLALTSFAAAVTLVSLEPIAVVLVAWVAFGTRPRALEAVGVALATAGAVATASSGSAEHRLVGDVMVLGAVLLYGLYVGAARGLRDALPAGAYAATVYGSSALTLSLVCLALTTGGLHFSAPPHSLLAIAALAVVPTLGGHTLVQWAARHVPPAVVALVSPGETIGSLLIGAALLGQSPNRHEAAGAGLVLAGVAATLVAQRRAAP